MREFCARQRSREARKGLGLSTRPQLAHAGASSIHLGLLVFAPEGLARGGDFFEHLKRQSFSVAAEIKKAP